MIRANTMKMPWCRWMLSFLLVGTFITGVNALTTSTAKFESWFPLTSRNTYEYASTTLCSEKLELYRRSLHGTNKTHMAATCSYQQACILLNLREDIKSRMASASVLLGLTPGLLASIGPSVAETAILSTQNPLLSILISLSCPAVYPSRVLEYADAQKVLGIHAFQPFSGLSTQRYSSRLAFVTVKYSALCVAIANVFFTSWDLGTKTVVSFRCINYTLPMVWTVLSMLIHVFASAAFYTRSRDFWSSRSQRGSSTRYNQIRQQNPISLFRNLDAQVQYPSSTQIHLHTRLVQSHPENDVELRVRPTNRSIIFNYIATFLGFIHVIFGIMVFSSLLFIELVDVVSVILRYMASTLVSRAILMYELDHIRRIVSREKERNADIVESTGDDNGSSSNSKDTPTSKHVELRNVMLTRTDDASL